MRNRTLVQGMLMAVAFTLGVAPALGGTIYDEGVSGDLSDDAGSPDPLGSLSLGDNIILGDMKNPDGIDAFTVVVPDGLQWTALEVVVLDQAGFANGFSIFLGIAPSALDVGSLNTGNSGLSAGDDIFSDIPGFFEPGVSAPLGPGTYQFDMRAFGDTFGADSYEFNLVVTPEPTSAALMGLGLFALRRRR